MNEPNIADHPMDHFEAQISALDDAIKTVEKTLAEADKGIDMLISKRGQIAADVQHLWNHRHMLKHQLDKMREAQDRFQNPPWR